MPTILAFCILTLLTLVVFQPAAAQQRAAVPRIGYLIGSTLSAMAARNDAFRQGLRELGYVEGDNIMIEWRSADGKFDRLPALAAELVRLKVEVIVSAGPAVTRPLKQATSTIPIVMGQDTDPVDSGFVASLARPGGNITGLATLSPEIAGKQLELLKEIVPRLSRAAVFGNLTNPGNVHELKETELAAGAFGVQIQFFDVQGPKDIESAFGAATKGRAEAIVVLGNPVLNRHRRQVVELAAKTRLPATYARPEFVEAGGLMNYGASYNDLFRRAAT
jgi:putative ABC transport system substrate-binding protein